VLAPGIPALTEPSQARVYDYLLGGKDNFAADREAGDAIEAMFPGMKVLVRQQREFARRAAAWLYGEGVRQFLDVGCGLPSRPAVGDVVPGCRVAYVDSDAVVLLHARALLAGPGAAAVAGDPARPGDVLGSGELREVIDLGEPAAVLLAGTLGGMDAGTARAAVRGYAAGLAPGSAIAVSCVSYADQRAADEAAAAYAEVTGGTWHSHSQRTIAGFFRAAGLEVARGGVADVRAWWEPVSTSEVPVRVLGAVGIKP